MVRIDVLPDDVLLEIFDFHVNTGPQYAGRPWIEEWQTLVHVCRRWRHLIFRSPLRLNLQLFCTPQTPAKDILGVWPALPLIIEGSMALSITDNVIAALGQSNRVCQVFLRDLADWQLEKVLAAMQVPFPELVNLRLFSDGKSQPLIPDSFVGAFAPRLRNVSLSGIPFPGLPKMLLSATHLVYLGLTNIPHSGYISPEAMIALISVLSSLESFLLGFQSPQSRPNWGSLRPPPSKRSVMPILNYIFYEGVIEYLEDLVTFIDAPQLNHLCVTFFNQIDFDTPRLAQFINCTPELRKRDAHVQFHDRSAGVVLSTRPICLEIAVSCREPDWQLSSVAQFCNSLTSLSIVEDLFIEHEYSQLVWRNDAIEDTLWLELLLPFTAVKNLYLSTEFAPGIAATLTELIGSRIEEVLPNLQNIFVEGLEPAETFQKDVGRFFTARQLSDHSIAISHWDKYSDTDSESM